MGIPCDHAGRDILSKFLILLPLRDHITMRHPVIGVNGLGFDGLMRMSMIAVVRLRLVHVRTRSRPM